MQRGDIIIEFDGTSITDVRALQDIVAKTPPNKKVSVVIMRDKKKKTLSLTTAEMPTAEAMEEEQEGHEKDR
ncbi:MAG: PDZ domain-containing protein [Elusimicrobia bacterium]|nr:PDZ domain-containing protein [Elusimicrobiota bacterium]MBD3412733.1 PDZ domain-containing protein [Elusimicrobiota bacterium]